jgi:hypothetical protein
VADEYQGHPYISVRLWQRDSRTGAWWPQKGRGVSVRLSEARGVAEALEKALEMADRGMEECTTPGQGGGYALSGAQRQGRRQGYPSRGRDLGSADSLPPPPGIGSGPPDEDL